MSQSQTSSVPGRSTIGLTPRRYLMFALPALLVIAAVIVFPWVFTLIMSVMEFKVD